MLVNRVTDIVNVGSKGEQNTGSSLDNGTKSLTKDIEGFGSNKGTWLRIMGNSVVHR